MWQSQCESGTLSADQRGGSSTSHVTQSRLAPWRKHTFLLLLQLSHAHCLCRRCSFPYLQNVLYHSDNPWCRNAPLQIPAGAGGAMACHSSVCPTPLCFRSERWRQVTWDAFPHPWDTADTLRSPMWAKICPLPCLCFGWSSSLVCAGTAQGPAQELFSWGKKSSWVRWKNHSRWILLAGNMLVQSGLSEQNTAGGKGSPEQWSDLLQRLKFSSYLNTDLVFLSWR